MEDTVVCITENTPGLTYGRSYKVHSSMYTEHIDCECGTNHRMYEWKIVDDHGILVWHGHYALTTPKVWREYRLYELGLVSEEEMKKGMYQY